MAARKPSKNNLKKILIFGGFLVIAALLAALSLGIKKFLTESSFFLVKQIKTNLDGKLPGGLRKIDLPAGIVNKKNLLSLDIQSFASNLKEEYPQYKDIRANRTFPDTL